MANREHEPDAGFDDFDDMENDIWDNASDEAVIGTLVLFGALSMVGVVCVATSLAGLGTATTVAEVKWLGLTAGEAAQLNAALRAGGALSQAMGNLITKSLLAGGNGVAAGFTYTRLNSIIAFVVTAVNSWDHQRMMAFLGNYFGGGGPGPGGTWPSGYPLYPGGGGPGPSPSPITNPGPGGVGGPPGTTPPPPTGSPPPPPPGVYGDAEASGQCYVPYDVEFCYKLD